MNSKVIKSYCKRNNIGIYCNIFLRTYSVKQGDVKLYQSSDYQDCLDFITNLYINGKIRRGN